MGLSIGLDTAITGLRAAQIFIDTTAHNIANADTEGYSRQEVQFRAIPPAKDRMLAPTNPLQQLGLGVDSNRIRRLRDTLLDVQYRNVRPNRDQFQAEATALQRAEVTLNEPNDHAFQELLTRFFNGFREVSNQPESVAARAAAIEQGATLGAALNRASTMLIAQRTDLDSGVAVKVSDINAKAHEIAALNAQIRLLTIAGSSSNDLQDRRDLLLDDLSGLTGITITTSVDNVVSVGIGSRLLVDDITANDLATMPDAGNGNLLKVVWASDSADAALTSGEVFGTLKARDTHVSGLLSELNDIAAALITAVNAHHQAGYGLNNQTGLAFFTGTGAGDIAVNTALQSDPQSLAVASVANEPGNADTARALAGVQGELLLNSGTATIDDTYRALVSRLGVASQQATLQAENQDALTRHIDTSRQAVSGVSLDEEMSGLIKAQHAYQASAKVIATIDEILDTLVNRTG